MADKKRTNPPPREFWMIHILPGSVTTYGKFKRYVDIPGRRPRAVMTTDEQEFKALTAPGKGMRKATQREIREAKGGK